MSKIASSARKIALIAGAALTLSVAVSQAQAQTKSAAANQPLPTVQVPYADLNLDNQHARSVLVARIQNAVRAVCAPQAELPGVQGSLNYTKCVRQSMQRAAASVTVPQVRTALETMLTNGAGS